MNGTQAFEFLGNGGLWGFDRRYVGLDMMSHYNWIRMQFNIICIMRT